MKTKNFNKKLTFNKKTVADLNNLQLGRVMGYGTGVEPNLLTDYTCIATCPATCDVSCNGTCVTCTCTCYTDLLQQCNCGIPAVVTEF
jgi:hypothetical protein